MLKKIFAVFFAGMFFVAGAGAAVDARTKCYSADNPGLFYTYDTDVNPAITADYAIFFDNDKSDIPDVCETEVKTNVINKLKADAKDIETVLLIGSADSTGNSQHNAELAQKRVNTVNKLLQDAKVPVCEYEYDDWGDPKKMVKRCAHISVGESLYSAAGVDNTSQYFGRAVLMFVIYKGDICDEATIKALDVLSAKVTDTDVKPNLDAAKEICNSDKKDKMLLRSQRQKIMDAISAAIQKYPEMVEKIDLSKDEKARLLMVSLVHVRNDAIANRSVWTTDKGTFNYARLASDSIAGVVLGTAGGIITSNVVKKNQIKTGFEDVMCTVGGQNVANWGDEFRVGVK